MAIQQHIYVKKTSNEVSFSINLSNLTDKEKEIAEKAIEEAKLFISYEIEDNDDAVEVKGMIERLLKLKKESSDELVKGNYSSVIILLKKACEYLNF